MDYMYVTLSKQAQVNGFQMGLLMIGLAGCGALIWYLYVNIVKNQKKSKWFLRNQFAYVL
jgi:hypothetical protein